MANVDTHYYNIGLRAGKESKEPYFECMHYACYYAWKESRLPPDKHKCFSDGFLKGFHEKFFNTKNK